MTKTIRQIYSVVCSRYGESGGPWAGGTRLPNAMPPGMPRVPPWDDEAVLEEGARWKTDVWIHPVLFGRLLHSHRAAVPARGQPLEWGMLEGGASHRGTSVKMKKLRTTGSFTNGGGAWWGCRERCFLCYELVHNHTVISASASSALSLVSPGTKGLEMQIGAGTLSSGNPANQKNSNVLASTLWS